MPNIETIVAGLGMLGTVLQFLWGKRSRAKVARIADIAATAARNVMAAADALHVDTRQLVAFVRQQVRELGYGLGLSDKEMLDLYTAAERELGRLYMSAVETRFTEAFADPKLHETLRKAEALGKKP